MAKRKLKGRRSAVIGEQELREFLTRRPFATVNELDGVLYCDHRRVDPAAADALVREGFLIVERVWRRAEKPSRPSGLPGREDPG